MLTQTLTKKNKLVLLLTDGQVITILGPKSGRVKIAVSAPQEVRIIREPRTEQEQ